jgi:hypothetical protein
VALQCHGVFLGGVKSIKPEEIGNTKKTCDTSSEKQVYVFGNLYEMQQFITH